MLSLIVFFMLFLQIRSESSGVPLSRYEKKAKSKIARWQTISEAAAKQSKRRIVPEIQRVMSFKEAINYAKDMEIKCIPYELAEGMEKTRELIEGLKPGQDIAIFIGPEGGFDLTEVEKLNKIT